MPIALVSLLIPKLPVELLQVPNYQGYLVYQLKLLAEEIVRLEFLAKLSTRYKTIQSVSKKYIRYCSPSLLQYVILCRLTANGCMSSY